MVNLEPSTATHATDQIASPKGLVIGLRDSNEPELIPLSISDRPVNHLRWILVVEKEVSIATIPLA